MVAHMVGVAGIDWQSVGAGVGGLALIVAIVVGGLSLWVVPLYRQLGASTKAIRAKEDELDAVEPSVNARTSGQLVSESQRQRIVATERAPIERELARLKQERQFIIDKLPFFKS